jgi:hypothetical protein
MTVKVFRPEPVRNYDAGNMADRAESLQGLVVGFLGNLKPNADTLLHATEGLVLESGARETLYREKSSCSLGAPEAMLDELARTCQAAIVALGDCGSCTSWCIHDAVELDRRGIPSVAFVAEPFVELAQHEARGLGVPDLNMVILPYPMGGIDPSEIVRRAEAAFPDVRSALIGNLPAMAG